MNKSEEIDKWNHFVDYAKNSGFVHYIGNLSFINYKTGDIIKLVSDGKITFIKRNSIEEAEFTMKEGE